MDSLGNYWKDVWQRRMARRQALGSMASAGSALAAGQLVGCTGSKQPSAPVKETESEDTSSRATPGGIYKGSTSYNITTMNVLATTSFTTQTQEHLL